MSNSQASERNYQGGSFVLFCDLLGKGGLADLARTNNPDYRVTLEESL